MELFMTEPEELTANEELKLLKERADLMGIKYSNNIGLDTLRAKVNERLESSVLEAEKNIDKSALRKKVREEQLKLVRIRLTCMNPAKKAWRGEIFTVANSIIGTVKKFVPYDPKFYANGYHVPYCIYTMLKNKTFLDIRTEESTGGKTRVYSSYPAEFGIEVLPELTPDELQQLAVEQQAGNRIDLTDSN